MSDDVIHRFLRHTATRWGHSKWETLIKACFAVEPARRAQLRVLLRLMVDTIYQGGCWNWIGRLNNTGYGQITFDGRLASTHRLAYELLVGPIPAGLVLDHLCRNRACSNPKHLEAVTSKENILRGVGACAAHARKQTCKHGHPLEGTNLLVPPPQEPTRRRCRTCVVRNSRRRRERFQIRRESNRAA